MITTLSIDIETYSSVSLKGCGVYKYAESPDFRVLLFAYSINGGAVEVVDIESGEELPEVVKRAIFDDRVSKWAFDAAFERVCLSKHFKVEGYLDPKSWRCTMVWSASLGLPLSLEGAGRELGLRQQKMIEGKELIQLFCIPSSKQEDMLGRANALSYPDQWASFIEYNRRDVEVELGLQQRFNKYPLSDEEWALYAIDQKINDAGILIDKELVARAIDIDKEIAGENLQKAYEISGLSNPNSVQQLKAWLGARGIEATTLGKKAVNDIIKAVKGDAEAEELLKLRLEMAKTSVKKYETMERVAEEDGRVRGLLQFYGAKRTGRWAGRLVQVQNLPQNHLKDLELARAIVKAGDKETLSLLYPSPPKVLSELIRTAFIPADGHKFMVADFSAIEARVIAWLAKEQWRLDVFKTHGKIYEASAAQMFGVPVESIKKGDPLRQKGKIAELALGYGGGVGALKTMGALEMGLQEEELRPLVQAWRGSNPNITKLWKLVGQAAIRAIQEGGAIQVQGLKFQVQNGILFIRLHSGRRLAYIKPKLIESKFGGVAISYAGTGYKYAREETYGPKLVENIVQGLSRDILGEAIKAVDAAGYKIVMHVHDEIVVEAPKNAKLEHICELMGVTPHWAKGLELRADGYECDFYRKD